MRPTGASLGKGLKTHSKKGDRTWGPLDPHQSPGPGSFPSVLYCFYRHTEYAYTVLLWSLLYGAKKVFNCFVISMKPAGISWKFNLSVLSYKDDDILILCIILSVPFIKILWSLLFQNLPYFLVLEWQRLLAEKNIHFLLVLFQNLPYFLALFRIFQISLYLNANTS